MVQVRCTAAGFIIQCKDSDAIVYIVIRHLKSQLCVQGKLMHDIIIHNVFNGHAGIPMYNHDYMHTSVQLQSSL